MKKNILLEQFQKQKIPYCWNSFKIKNKKYHTVGTVSKSKTKIPYCWNSFKIKIGERSKTIPLIYT
jgi:hypothetical protein